MRITTRSAAVAGAIGLTATQALIVPGTGTPMPQDVADYMENARDHYVIPGRDCPVDTDDCNLVPVDYIAQFRPIPGWGGLQGAKWNVSVQSGVESLTGEWDDALDTGDPITIFGYSQGATVSSLFKNDHRGDSQLIENKTNFFFIGNPQRPAGGFFERLAFLGNVPILDAQFGNPTETDTCIHVDNSGNTSPCATDFALMYDGVVDFPEWILNPLAFVNAVAGFQYVHGSYLAPNGDDAPTETPYGYTVLEVQQAIEAAEADCSATYCQEHGDTIFITLPARVLPIYQLPLDIGRRPAHRRW